MASEKAAPSLFLGRRVDEKAGSTTGETLALDPGDLTTHGLIVGMTGSGKTALGIVIIEELLRAGVPVLAIDPKGDLGNLLLDFPGLSPDEFAPFVDSSGGATPEGEAKRWSEGLKAWGLGGKDVGALAAAREARLYTPGSTAGLPLDLFGSCPPLRDGADEEDRRDVLTAYVTSLLGLAGIEADPVKSRELILLAKCVESSWEKGSPATLESLIAAAANPPFGTVGALPVETFFPARERQGLVVALNNILASPASAAFRKGDALDVGALLEKGPGSLPKLSIVSVAHLSDAERLFVVATLLTRVKAWMRTRPGSTRLGALVYIDEIFGYFPPSKEPPTKKPLLTLLKQARAFGVGVVLATQNPVDLDYKGLANCGCWFVGTLQTERDRKRLADGLNDAGGGSRAADLLSKTRKRVFLLHDVHARGPILFETRWAMSYLRGPMTREDIARARALAGSVAALPRSVPGAEPASPGETAPPLPPPWKARWLRRRGAEIATPYVLIRYAVRYRSGGAAAPEAVGVKLFPLDAASAGEVMEGEAIDLAEPAPLLDAPPAGLRYGALPVWFGASAVKAVETAVRERLPDKLAIRLLCDPVTGQLSGPGETAEALAARVASSSGAPAAIAERLEKKRRELAAAEAQESGRSIETYATMATAAADFIGGLLGKRKTLRVGKVSSVLTKKRMEGAAENRVEALKADVAALEAQCAPPDPSRFEPVDVVPLKAHVDVLAIGVAWVA